MIIEWYDEGRFSCPSETNPKTEGYTVDLVRYGGNGFCTCKDFEFHHEPHVTRGRSNGDRTRCKHIIEVRRQIAYGLLDHHIKAMVEKQRKDAKNEI